MAAGLQLLAVRLCAAMLPAARPDGRRERFADPDPRFLADLARHAAAAGRDTAAAADARAGHGSPPAYDEAVQVEGLALLGRMAGAGFYADVRVRVEACEALPQMDRYPHPPGPWPPARPPFTVHLPRLCCEC